MSSRSGRWFSLLRSSRTSKRRCAARRRRPMRVEPLEERMLLSVSTGENADEQLGTVAPLHGVAEQSEELFSLYSANIAALASVTVQSPWATTLAQPDWTEVLEGDGSNSVTAVGVDAEGNVFVAGSTLGSQINDVAVPPSEYQGQSRGTSFVAKYSPDGQMLWLRFLDRQIGKIDDIALGSAGEVFLTGQLGGEVFLCNTASDVGSAADDQEEHDGDMFVAKLSPAGDVEWVEYAGGSGLDYAHHLVLDSDGNLIVTGRTGSEDWLGAVNEHPSPNDGCPYVAKFSAEGQLLWVRYGSAFTERVAQVATDAQGNIWVVGTTESDTLEAAINEFAGGPEGAYPATDAFVTKLTPDGQVRWSRYLGHDASETGRGMMIDASGRIFVAVSVDRSPNGEALWPTPRVVFLTELASDGSVVRATPIPGLESTGTVHLAADRAGNVWVGGIVDSTNAFWHGGEYLVGQGGEEEVLLTCVSPFGHVLWQGTIGGSGGDTLGGIALDAAGNLSVAWAAEKGTVFGNEGSDANDAGQQDDTQVVSWYQGPHRNVFVTHLSTFADLGEVQFRTLEDLSVAADSLYFTMSAARDGLLTLEATGFQQDEQVTIDLYAENPFHGPDAQPVASSQLSGDTVRLDYQVHSRDRYFVTISGNSHRFDLAIANLVQLHGTTLILRGTNGDDVFELDASASPQVTINGIAYHFDHAEVTNVQFAGRDGQDQAILRGSSDDQWVRLANGSAVLRGDHFRASVTGTEQIHVEGGGGNDRVYFVGSRWKDMFAVGPTAPENELQDAAMWSRDSDGTLRYHNSASGFSHIDAIGQGGYDQVRMYGSAVVGTHLDVVLDYVRMSIDGWAEVRAFGFEQLGAYGRRTGADRLRVWSNGYNAELTGNPHRWQLDIASFDPFPGRLRRLVSVGFQDVTVLAEAALAVDISDSGPNGADELMVNLDGRVARFGGDDYVLWSHGFTDLRVSASDPELDSFFYKGHAGDETLEFFADGPAELPAANVLALSPDGSELLQVTTEGFGAIRAVAGLGGHDAAKLHGSDSAADRFWADPFWAQMEGAGYAVRAASFDQYQGYASPEDGFHDVAILRENPITDDLLEAHPNYVRLRYGGSLDRSSYAAGFDAVISYIDSTLSDNTAEIWLTPGVDEQVDSRMETGRTVVTGGATSLDIEGYDRVTIHGNHGDADQAEVFDSNGDEHLAADGTGDPGLVTIANAALELRLRDISHVLARSSSGDDTRDVRSPELLDFLLKTTGNWRDV